MKFLKTIRVEELKQILYEIPRIALKEETIELDFAFGRVISEDIVSSIDVPHFRKSRMDGYAIVAEDTFNADENNTIALELIETIQAGDKPQKEVNKGQCSYVATGAAIPKGANGVVMVEFTEKQGTTIHVSQAVTPDTYIVKIGHDVAKGGMIVPKDSLITLPTIGILASTGC